MVRQLDSADDLTKVFGDILYIILFGIFNLMEKSKKNALKFLSKLKFYII